MEQDNISFSVQMRAGDLFRFKMYHGYHSASGLFGMFLTLLAAVMLATGFSDMPMQTRLIWLLIIVWFVCIDPFQFWLHARREAKKNKVYQKPLEYRIDRAGITVSQDEAEQTMGWERVVKMIETKSQFIVYSSRVHAFIFPKDAVGGREDVLRSVLRVNAAGAKCKGFPKGGKK